MRMKEIIINTDWDKWVKNTAIFFAPFMLMFLVSIQQGATLKESLNIIYLFGLNTAIDLLRKFISANSSL